MNHDPRDIRNGWDIPGSGYYFDQPYVVVLPDGTWLCTMTTGRGREGARGQHIVALRSRDRGRTWTVPAPIEPPEGPVASWAMPLLVPPGQGVGGEAGRVYVFYVYNAEDRRGIVADDPPYPGGVTSRVDTLGQYTFRFSDDGGRTWSDRRFIPVREYEIDRRNPTGGEVRFFWGVGKPIVHRGAMYFGFAKVGRFGPGFMAESEACFLRSDNILTEPNPDRIQWQTLPEGDHGLRSPDPAQWPVADEANLAGLSDGSLFCTYRTTAGAPCHAYSRDGGRTWSGPEFMSHHPGGPIVNNPRAANFVRRLSTGGFLYWFHNHNGTTYRHRNPAWLLGGTEHDSPEGKIIHWSRPEVVLYDRDIRTRMSYPDFIEDPPLTEPDGRLFITETVKTHARVHEVEPELFRRLTAARTPGGDSGTSARPTR